MSSHALAYGDLTFHETHPGLIAGIATLAGITPPSLSNCRVLELGCGTGFNLLAISQSIPSSQCLGIDFDPAHIQRATEAAAQIGGSNITFRCESIDDFPAPGAPFDFIIAHGVYSWVSAATRDATLALIRKHLAPNGLAYVSYNTNPGWRLRTIARDAMRFFSAPADHADSSIPVVRAGMELLMKGVLVPDSIYAQVLREEAEPLRAAPDYYIAHEYIVTDNHPVYFQEFTEHAAAHQLQYAAEARYLSNSFALAEDIRLKLDEGAGPDLLRREQYLDFLAGRYFRQSLLCHADVKLDYDTGRLLDLHLARTSSPETEIPDEPSRLVRDYLLQGGPVPIPARTVQDLVVEALGMAALPGLGDPILSAVLGAGWRATFWALRTDVPPLVREISDRPTACPLARLQARNSRQCTNRLHRTVSLTAEERELIQQLDGTFTTNHPALVRLAAEGFLIA